MIDENLDALEQIHQRLRDNFAGKIVRKDLTKKIKEGANVPVYVLEYLLGMYCSSHFFWKKIKMQSQRPGKMRLRDTERLFWGNGETY